MINKIIYSLLTTGILICLLINLASACSPDPTPLFEVKTKNVERCFFKSYNETILTDVVDFIKERDSPHYKECENLTLSQDDKITFKQTIEQYNKNHYLWEHIYIQEQSDEEYNSFLQVVEEKNSNRCDCDKFSNISREGNWTIYKRCSSCSSICGPSPPAGCPRENILFPVSPNPITAIIWIIIIIAIVIGSIFLIKRITKTSRKR